MTDLVLPKLTFDIDIAVLPVNIARPPACWRIS